MRANQRGSGVVYRLHSNAITERTLIFTKQLSVHLGRSACRTSTVIHLSVGTISGFIKMSSKHTVSRIATRLGSALDPRFCSNL